MQALLIGAGVITVLAVLAVWAIMRLSKRVGAADLYKDSQDEIEKRRRDADEVMVEPVADEAAWVRKQTELAQEAEVARRVNLARQRLRDLQRRTGRGPR